MMKLLLIWVSILVTGRTFSQQKAPIAFWRLTVVDNATSKSVEKATVVCIKGSVLKSFLTDIHGKVTINKSVLNLTDSIKITCIGYKPALFKPSGEFPDTIRLSASTIALDEVKIKTNSKKIVLGNAGKLYDGGYLAAPNEEIAEYIPNNEKIRGTIIYVEFAINNGKKGIDKPFKVNLYSKSNNSMYPGSKLISDSIISYNPKKLQVVRVDISKYGIQIPEDGFFVGFETLSPSWYNKDPKTGHAYLPVPGIKGHFKNHNFVFDETERKGVKYSLYRDIAPSGSWSIFEDGTDFAIGAAVLAD